MSAGSSTEVRFQSSDGDLGDYRQFSIAALVSLVLGLLSPLALVGPLLWIVPAAAVAVSLYTIWLIDRSDDPPTGRLLAVIGLAIALLFGFAAPARSISREMWIQSRAEEFASQWLELFTRAERYRAHQFMLPVNSRLPLDDRLESKYLDSVGLSRNFSEEFNSNSAIKKLLALGGQVNFEILRVTMIKYNGDDLVQFRYRAEPARTTDVEPFVLNLVVKRSIGPGEIEEWMINSVSSDTL